MKPNNMDYPIESPVFDAFRQKEKKIKEAISLLRENDYVVYKQGEYKKDEKEKTNIGTNKTFK